MPAPPETLFSASGWSATPEDDMFDEMLPHHTHGQTFLRILWCLMGIAALILGVHWFLTSH